MAKQWIKQEMKRNEVESAVGKGMQWAMGNRQTTLAVAGAILAALVLAAGLLYRNHSMQTTAWDRLSVAQNYAYGGQPAASLQQLKELTADYGGTKAAGYAHLFAGDILFRQGSFKEAVESYAKVSEGSDAKLASVALADTSLALEAAGQYQQAIAAAQRFLDAHADSFLAPQVHSSLGRSQHALGQIDQAKATYQKISLQYPDTPWAGWAQSKLSGN